MAKAHHTNREAEWFGYKKVKPQDKAGLVKDVFDSVAPQYDLMNDLMSGGIHRLWKRKFVRLMRPLPGKTLLDVAGGTGDIAFLYRARAGAQTPITVCDINAEMLRVGKGRGIDRGYLKNFSWVLGNAEDLPFEDQSFSLYSIAFGLRNVPHIDDALQEAHRVLKIGGQFFCLEFSHPQNKILEKIYETYSFRIIPKIGEWVAKDRESYQYLVESIRQFPTVEDLKNRILQAGFDKVRTVSLSGGIATIHIGLKG